MITGGLSCDRIEFGHFGGGQMTPPDPPGYGPVMPGWNEVTEFSDFVYPCNAGYPS